MSIEFSAISTQLCCNGGPPQGEMLKEVCKCMSKTWVKHNQYSLILKWTNMNQLFLVNQTHTVHPVYADSRMNYTYESVVLSEVTMQRNQ